MDCRETQELLTAFHDGELPDADRTRVEHHLRGCRECGRLLADLARADEIAGVPDPGPGYWDRFNARVADRIEREAEGPRVAVLRPKQGWMRQQLRFLVPAVAAAALVVVVVRYGGQSPVAPKQTLPPAVSVTEPSTLDSAESKRAAEAPAATLPPLGQKGIPAVGPARRDELADQLRTEGREMASKDRAAATAGIGAPSPAPLPSDRNATAASPPATAEEGSPRKVHEERKKMAEAAPSGTRPQLAAKAVPESGMKDERASPCEMARTLAGQGRLKEAEAAQRECLALDPSPPTQEKGLIFLAELLDRQARFAEADQVLSDVHKQFPKSLPLTLYRQQRPMVQKQQMPVPVTR
jgi:hypothetical protein